jgi:hypothetical protein
VAHISEAQIQYFLRSVDRSEQVIQTRIAQDARDEYNDDRLGYSTCSECGSTLLQAGYYQRLCAQCAGAR